MKSKITPFHEGELAVQTKLGVAQKMDPIGKSHIRPYMPEQHRIFFQQLPFIVLGVLDMKGRPWVTAAFGPPGFVQCPDERSLVISKPVMLAERLDLDLRANSKVGAIGIEPPTGRRNRVNGVVQNSSASGLTLAVDQSFGNCAQYIHRRKVRWKKVRGPKPGSARVERGKQLSDPVKRLISEADTFFIASRSRQLSTGPSAGVDVSHRGGKKGVVQIKGQDRLEFIDFPGNNFFNTLGNIHEDGRVGLLFPETSTNSAVFLTGNATINWAPKRLVSIQVARVLHLSAWSTQDALPD